MPNRTGGYGNRNPTLLAMRNAPVLRFGCRRAQDDLGRSSVAAQLLLSVPSGERILNVAYRDSSARGILCRRGITGFASSPSRQRSPDPLQRGVTAQDAAAHSLPCAARGEVCVCLLVSIRRLEARRVA